MVRCGWQPWIPSPKKLIYNSVNKTMYVAILPSFKPHSDELIPAGTLLDSVVLKQRRQNHFQMLHTPNGAWSSHRAGWTGMQIARIGHGSPRWTF